MLLEVKVKDFVEDVASSKPAPGGGSVAALTSSLGSALTSMVGNLTIGRKAYEKLTVEQKKQLDHNFVRSQELIKALNRLTEEDTTAFNGVMAAFKLPKGTEEEKKKRSEEIQKAMKEALEVPLTVAKESLEVLKIQKSFGDFGNPNAITDVGVGALLAYAGLEGALFNVLINLQSIKDEEYVKEIREKCDALKSEGNRLKNETLEVVYSKLN